MAIDIKRSLSLAGLFTAAMWVITLVMNKVFGSATSALFAVTSYPSAIPAPIAPFSGTFGGRLVTWFSGLSGVTFDWNTLALTFITALVAVILAELAIQYLRLPTFKGKIGRIASIIMWGTVPIYGIMVGKTVPSITVLIGVGIYVIAASYITAWLADKFKISI